MVCVLVLSRHGEVMLAGKKNPPILYTVLNALRQSAKREHGVSPRISEAEIVIRDWLAAP